MAKTLHIFPSTLAVEAFNKRELAHSGVLFGTTALTLRGLSEKIFASSPVAARFISNVGRKLLLEEVVEVGFKEQNGHLSRITSFPGFVGALDSCIGELKQAMITAGQFTATVRSFPHNGRLLELASLYDAYDSALEERGLMDRHNMELAALGYLREGGKLPPLFEEITAVSIHALYDVTPLQLALITELSRRLPVELRLPYNPARENLYAYVAKTADAVESIDNSELLLEPVFVEPAGIFFTPLVDRVFDGSGKREPLAPPGPMALVAAPGAYRECEEIGRRIRGLMEKGVDPANIAVLFRDPHSYAPMMEDVCLRFRIPVSYRRGAPLVTSQLVRACLAPFAVLQSRCSREELVALCGSSYLGGAVGGVSPVTIEEILLSANYIDETMGAADEMIGRRIAGLRKAGKNPELEERVLQALLPILADLRRFKGRKTVGEFTLLLETFIEKHRIYARGIETAERRALKRDASAISLFQQVLRDLEADMATLGLRSREVTPDEFTELLREGMEGAFLAGERQGGVSILTFHDARGLSFPHVFIGGLTEAICPKRHDGHPLFKDSDKLLYQRAIGKRLFRTAKEKGEEEPLLFHLAVGCAEHSLTLSYSYADNRGNELLRSPFLDDLMVAVTLEEVRIPIGQITPAMDECLEREELLNSVARNMGCHVAPDLILPLRDSLTRIAANGEIELERERFFTTEDLATRSDLSTPYTGSIRNGEILGELKAFYDSPEGNSFAPTTLEEYGCCPFRYFLKRLLKLSPVEQPDRELEAREEGSLIHEILKVFFQRMKQEGKLPLRGDSADMSAMRDEAERVFTRWETEKYTGEPLLWEMEKGKLLPILERLVELEGKDDSGLVPFSFELPFDRLEVEDRDGSRFFLSGKIDRVDVSPASGRLRVVDYKLAGNSQKYREFLKKEALGETSFQIPVYLLAAARAMGEECGTAFTRFTALYWLMRRLNPLAKNFKAEKNEEFSGFFAIDPEERSMRGDDNFLNRLCATVQSMKSGDFQITPKECEFCDFKSVCRYVEVSLRDDA